MLTKLQIDSLPPGEYSNSQLRKAFGTKHGTPVKFLTDPKNKDLKPEIVVLISNRWWSRFRKKNPIVLAKAKKQNITTEMKKVEDKAGLLGKVWGKVKSFFK